MKHFFSFLLVFVLLMSSAIAETPGEQETRAFTADEQAYDVYLDITQAYSDSVLYLEELGILWNKVNETGSKKIDYLWVSDYVAADFERFVALQRYTESFYGISDAQDMLIQLFSLTNTVEEKTDVIWLYLSILKDANYIRKEADIKQNLDDAMAGIRSLMAMDRSYPFLGDLQSYYKEAVMLHNYIADFSDNYTGFTAKLEEYQTNKTSREIDFEFIFNPDDFDYVREVRDAEKMEAIEVSYQHAIELENNGKYSEAIALFMTLGLYKDCNEHISRCRAAISESKYQEAYALESQGRYAEAAEIYKAIKECKDSADRAAYCENHIGYEDIHPFSEGLAAVKKNGKWGFIDTCGNLVIPFTDEYVPTYVFSDGLAVVSTKGGKYGYINTKGEIAIPCIYTNAKAFSEGVAAVQPSGGDAWGYINKNGDMVIPAKHYNAYPFSDGLAGTSKGFINTKGELVTPILNTTSVGQLSEGLAIIMHRGKTTTVDYVDKTGKVVISGSYDFVYPFSEGFSAVRKNDKWGFIDKSGKLVISLQYDHATDWRASSGFCEGYVCVKKNKKYGLVDSNNTLVLPFEYDVQMEFNDGHILLLKDGIIHIMNHDLEIVY